MPSDICNKNDLEVLVRSFYNELLKDERMQKPFENLNFEEHIPHIVAFWAFVALEEEGYKTNVFDKHRHLPIEPFMFEIWLNVWKITVDKLHAGPVAELVKQRAEVLALTFKHKWQKGIEPL